MEQLIIGGILAFIVTFYAIPVIIQVAKQKKLYDLPGERKIHTTPIPSLGGLGIFIGFMMGLLLVMENNSPNPAFPYYIAAFLVVFFFGIKDDILVLTPMKKFMGQLMVAAILVFKGGLVINNMHGFLGIGALNNTTSYFLSVFTIIVVMNAYNLIDGVDCLAGSVSVITCSVMALYFYLTGDTFFAIMGFTFAASLIGFLIYNYSPAKIFMGDTGAMLSGTVNVILVIRFIETAHTSAILPIAASPAMGFGILLMPLLDTLRVFGIRIMHGRSPFSPDRNHLHHLLLDRGMNHLAVTSTIAISAILFIIISYLALPLGTTKLILLQLALFFTGIYLLNVTKPKKMGEMRVIKGQLSEDKAEKKSLISLAGSRRPMIHKD